MLEAVEPATAAVDWMPTLIRLAVQLTLALAASFALTCASLRTAPARCLCWS